MTDDSGSEDDKESRRERRKRELAALGTPEEELSPIGIGVRDDLDMLLGYDNATGWEKGCSGEFIGVWIVGDDLVVTDGYSTLDGNTRAFISWDQTAGRNLLRRAAEESDEHSIEDVPEKSLVKPLSKMLEEDGYNIGGLDCPGDSAFLLDTRKNQLYIGDKSTVTDLCEKQNEPPEIIEELPDDPEEASKVFFEAVSRAGSNW